MAEEKNQGGYDPANEFARKPAAHPAKDGMKDEKMTESAPETDPYRNVPTAAIVVAAGSGKRMKLGGKKQFMDFRGKPLVYYPLAALEISPVQDVVLVTGKDDLTYCRTEIVDRYDLKKVRAIVPGGRERWNSVFEGLKKLAEMGYEENSIVLIQDGARPFLSKEIIQRTIRDARIYGACVAAIPAKDTIKIADIAGFADRTPARSRCWQIQTPQAFSFGLIYGAYRQLMMTPEMQEEITDDAMVVEKASGKKVKLTRGSNFNIKITTRDDIPIADAIYEYQQNLEDGAEEEK